MGKLEGKIAIVTGAGAGIGKGIAIAMAKEGAKVIIAEINPATCEEAAQEIRHLGKEAVGMVCNVGNREQVKRVVSDTVARFGTVDILVNNAQGLTKRKPAEETTDEEWDFSYQTGPKAAWYFCTAVYPYMKDRGGKIINISSSAGTIGMKGNIVYNAVKEAMKGLSRTLATEWSPHKVNVNVICPLAWTEASLRVYKASPDEFKPLIEANPMRRWGDAEKDIGRVAVFLASEDSDFMTGQTLLVEGGSNMT